MNIYCFDQERERLGCSNLAGYAERAIKLSHPALLKVLDVHVSDDGRWRLITAGMPERILLLDAIANDIGNVAEACSVALTLAEAYSYLYRTNFRGGKTFSWEIECIAAARGPAGELRLAMVPPAPYDIESLEREGFYGNPRFAATELIADPKSKPNEATDSFTLGAILYQLLTKRPLIPAASPMDAMKLAYEASFPPVESLNGAVPAELGALVNRAIGRDAAARPGLREWSFVMEKFGGRMLEQPEVSRLERIPDAIAPAAGYRRVLGPVDRAASVVIKAPGCTVHGGATSGFSAVIAEDSSPLEPLADGRVPSPPADGVIVDDNVQFTVFRPKTVQPDKWYAVLAYAHLEELPDDADPSEPTPQATVLEKVGQKLGAKVKQYKETTEDSSQAVPREGELTFVPEMEGVEFNPRRYTFRWCEQVHEAEFRMKASPAFDGKQVVGQMSVFLGAILLADITLKIKVDSRHREGPDEQESPERAKPYRKIFASYSHRDLAIVEQFEHYAHAMGDRYIRDWKDLRAGENWDHRLLEMIEEADVFQLFWSQNSMRSEFVRREWEHALSLKNKGPAFVRPTYWETPFPAAPEEELPPPHLSRLHFTQLAAAAPAKDLEKNPPESSFPPIKQAAEEQDLVASEQEGDTALEDEAFSLSAADSGIALGSLEDAPLLLEESCIGGSALEADDSDFELTLDDDSSGPEALDDDSADSASEFSLSLDDYDDSADSASAAMTVDAEDSSDFDLCCSGGEEEDESGTEDIALDCEEFDSAHEIRLDDYINEESTGLPRKNAQTFDEDAVESVALPAESAIADDIAPAEEVARSEDADFEDESDPVVVSPRRRIVTADDDECDDELATSPVQKARSGPPWFVWAIFTAAVTLSSIVGAHLLGLF